MSDHEEKIAQFQDVTGVEETASAEQYLDSADWNVNVAIANYFEIRGEDDLPLNEEAVSKEEAPCCYQKQKQTKSKPKKKTNFGTLQDLQNKESSSEEEEGQAFYAGGSETSGQQILGPGKKVDIITDMFKSCQKQAIPHEASTSTTTQHRPTTFLGTGYKLGMTSNDTEVVTPTTSERRSSTGLITLKLWQNGFTINDREIQSYDDPENREFLAAIKRGEIPMAIRQEVQGGEVRLDMENHRYEEYVPPKPKIKAFSGKGQMLGSPSPAAAGVTIPTDPADEAANETLARDQLNFNSELPLTAIQIRLADGSNIRAQFNLTHTLGDIRRYVSTIRPQYAVREFCLQTTFPSKELTEENKTIEELNLQNSAIIQRLK